MCSFRDRLKPLFIVRELVQFSMANAKKRIGLVLASIHTGISLNVWDSFAGTASNENVSLFIFPGGRLNAFQDYENLRNPVYRLVNNENLDGCISWSSAIQYRQPQEEFEHFHAEFEPLPYVTLGFKVPGHPCVDFDAYNGMKTLVNHCIQVHGAKKIAFLRGPDFHQSAQARLEGYCDAVREAGLAGQVKHSPLVTDPFHWSAGEAAAAQLFEERALVPGRDFDTLAGSSDLMALGAVNYFAKHGYHAPVDYRAVGFNNSGESRIAESPLSTVHLPFAEMSRESFKILLGILGKKKQKSADYVLLETHIIVRESCGCFLNGSADKAFCSGDAARHGPAAGASMETLAKMAREYLPADSAAMSNYVMPVIQSFLSENRECFFQLFEKAALGFLVSGREPENLLRFFADMVCANEQRLEPALYRSIIKVREQVAVRERYEKERCNTVLNSLKCDLLGTRDRFSLIQNLASHLPKIGINIAAIILYNDEKTSVFVGGFTHDGMCPIREQRFPARLLVPSGVRAQFEDGVFLVQPLFIENQSLGYFIHNVSVNDGVICEELRSSVSYALKGIFLLEETVRAKKIAEQAERAKTEFLQTLENGLFDPLQGIKERLEKIEKRVESFSEKNAKEPYKSLCKDIRELKSFVAFKETEAGSMMDFTLARLDELDLHKTIFSIEELLPKIGTFPLLLGDTARLAQCFSLIREHYSVDYSAELCYNGISVTFRGSAADGKTRGGKTGADEKARQFSLLLAERIILMHGGHFSLYRDHCTATLPWTSLTGHELSKNTVNSQNNVLVLSDPAFLPANFFTLPQIRTIESALPGKTAFVTWNAAGAGPEELVKVSSLRHRNELAGIPFLCYGMPSGAGGAIDSAASVIDAVEFALKSPKKGAVLFIGSNERANPEHFPLPNETHLDKIHIDSMAAFNRTVGEINPLLIVINSFDMAGIEAVRRHPLTVMVPVVMICSRINSAGDIIAMGQYSRLIICHHAVVSSREFQARIQALIGGDEILPPHTGVLVKKAILYFDQHAESHISRWKLADSVHVSEDYLTRIFHREMGLSLWDYLNHLRIFRAAELLRMTNESIQNIALQTGFQDQAYFCRVFKKICGFPPGQLRKQ